MEDGDGRIAVEFRKAIDASVHEIYRPDHVYPYVECLIVQFQHGKSAQERGSRDFLVLAVAVARQYERLAFVFSYTIVGSPRQRHNIAASRIMFFV